MLLGCIGDDFTGSSDLANTLAKEGMRVVQYAGIPDGPAKSDVEAGVVSLKTRSIPAADAVAQSLAALEWLQAQGCEQFFFKYCSTFDSTPEGNIGPVAEALAVALNANRVIVCPAFPSTGRTVYQGCLFVNDKLLNESGMENHPLTPMTDPDLRRWLAQQTTFTVGHVAAPDVFAGADRIKDMLGAQQALGKRMVVVDALRDQDLYAIGAAAKRLPLITGGSGVALGLPRNFAERGLINGNSGSWRGETGKCVALSGSCSIATRGQIAQHQKDHQSLLIDPAKVMDGSQTPEDVADWLETTDGIPLAYSSADPAEVAAVQKTYGRDKSAAAIEGFFADVARALVARGVRKILTAGGETSGAVVEGLDLTALEIGPEIDPGVPALRAGDDLVVALKSGNFGRETYFAHAARILDAAP